MVSSYSVRWAGLIGATDEKHSVQCCFLLPHSRQVSLCTSACEAAGTFFVVATPRLYSFSAIPPSSELPHPPTGSASFSVSPVVAPRLLCQLSWVTWINDNSRGFTVQPHPLHIPGRSAAGSALFLTLNAQHSAAPFPLQTLLTLLLVLLSLRLFTIYGTAGVQPYVKSRYLIATCAAVVFFFLHHSRASP